MLRYVIKRVLQAIPVLLGLSIVVFLIMRVFSADPASVVLGEHATQEQMQAWREANGLTAPIVVQYLNFLGSALRGDLGTSFTSGLSVNDQIASRMAVTLSLTLAVFGISLIVAILIGAWSSWRSSGARIG